MKNKIKILLLAFLVSMISSCTNKPQIQYHELLDDKPLVQEAVYLEYALCDKDSIAMMNLATGHFIAYGHDFIIPIDNLSFLSTDFWVSPRTLCWQKLVDKAVLNKTTVIELSDLQPGYNTLFNLIRRVELSLSLDEKILIDTSKEWYDATTMIYGENINYNFRLNEKGIIIKLRFAKIPFYSEILDNNYYGNLDIEYKHDVNSNTLALTKACFKSVIDDVEWVVKMRFSETINRVIFNKNEYEKILFVNDSNPFIVNSNENKADSILSLFENIEKLKSVVLKSKEDLYRTYVSTEGESKTKSPESIITILDKLK
jgi:hypothetical protein